MEFRQLRYFVKIADTGSLSRASQVLHIAQPALSQQLAQLEAELGHQLLFRRHNGVTMTQAGQAFYRNARRILKDLDDLKGQVDQAATDICGTVTIGLPQSTAVQFAALLMPEVRARLPGVRVEYFDEISGNLLAGLRSGRFDMSVLVNDHDASLTEAVPVLDEELFLVGAHDSPMPGNPVPISLLGELPLTLPGPEHGVRQLVEQAVARAGGQLGAPALVANSMAIMRHAIRGGMAYGVMPWAAVQADAQRNEHGDALQLASFEPRLSRRVYLCRERDGEPSPAAQALWQLLREKIIDCVAADAWPGGRLVA